MLASGHHAVLYSEVFLSETQIDVSMTPIVIGYQKM